MGQISTFLICSGIAQIFIGLVLWIIFAIREKRGETDAGN